MDEYEDSMRKIALCLTGAQLAKNLMVEEFGIGEELAFNFFGWRDNRLVMVAQLRREYMNLPVAKRLEACKMLCVAMTSHWAIDAISFVAEGFETLRDSYLPHFPAKLTKVWPIHPAYLAVFKKSVH